MVLALTLLIYSQLIPNILSLIIQPNDALDNTFSHGNTDLFEGL